MWVGVGVVVSGVGAGWGRRWGWVFVWSRPQKEFPPLLGGIVGFHLNLGGKFPIIFNFPKRSQQRIYTNLRVFFLEHPAFVCFTNLFFPPHFAW